MKKDRKKIIVGMSGGVDSSVTAALLKEKGYEVTGVFMRFWKADEEKKNKAENDAKRVAEILEIPLKVVDVRERFKKKVVEYFLDEYDIGRTPNPCVFCNENLKFKVLFEEMTKLKADYVATGHYACLPKSKIKNIKSEAELFKAKDKNKDQSYFLYRLKQEQLSRIIFLMGEYKKEDVRKLAKKFKLPVWEKKESQDICFLGVGSAQEFLKKNLKLKEGEIADIHGKVIGTHLGLALYTLGQRKGINIGGTGPYYVIKKDYKKNQLIITNEPQKLSLFSMSLTIEKVNWIGKKPDFPARFLARTRYRNSLVYATIKKCKAESSKYKAKFKVEFEKPQRAVTSGQSVVFYAGKGSVVGGGIVTDLNLSRNNSK